MKSHDTEVKCACTCVHTHTLILRTTLNMNSRGETLLLVSYKALDGTAGVVFMQSLMLVLRGQE